VGWLVHGIASDEAHENLGLPQRVLDTEPKMILPRPELLLVEGIDRRDVVEIPVLDARHRTIDTVRVHVIETAKPKASRTTGPAEEYRDARVFTQECVGKSHDARQRAWIVFRQGFAGLH
jgi:hypothetical protein